jgi:hypothetical protein
MYSVRNHDDLERCLQWMHEGRDPELERRLKIIPEYFVMPGERSIGSAIKDHMLAAVRGHDMPLKHGFTPCLPTLASSTCSAPANYAERKAAALEDLLSRIGRVPSAIDIGCGDGHYTRQICAHADFTKVIDADAEKVAQAKILLAGCNIEINRESITHAGTCQTYDLISCLGVTSGMTEHGLFLKALDLLVASCREDGYLLLEDTLSTGVERLQTLDGAGTLLYRNILDYKECFLSRGCVLEAEVDLFALPDETLVNKLFLFKGKRRSNA